MSRREERIAVITRKEATLAAVRFFQSIMPDAAVREVDTHSSLKHWVIHFIKLLPPDVIESPGSWCVKVDAMNRQVEWFETL